MNNETKQYCHHCDTILDVDETSNDPFSQCLCVYRCDPRTEKQEISHGRFGDLLLAAYCGTCRENYTAKVSSKRFDCNLGYDWRSYERGVSVNKIEDDYKKVLDEIGFDYEKAMLNGDLPGGFFDEDDDQDGYEQ